MSQLKWTAAVRNSSRSSRSATQVDHRGPQLEWAITAYNSSRPSLAAGTHSVRVAVPDKETLRHSGRISYRDRGRAGCGVSKVADAQPPIRLAVGNRNHVAVNRQSSGSRQGRTASNALHETVIAGRRAELHEVSGRVI